MNREEKIELLKRIASGKASIQEALPIKRVDLLEVEPGKYMDMVGEQATVSVDEYVAHIRRRYPRHRVELSVIHYSLYLRISEVLEADC